MTEPASRLETFDNPAPERDYTIRMSIPEFSCLCPKTGQPDFATLELEYVPDERCVELKSLKLYIWSFRSRGAFHEAVTNEILRDLVGRDRAAIHAACGRIQRAGRHLHHGRGGTPRRRLDAGRAGHTALAASGILGRARWGQSFARRFSRQPPVCEVFI